MHQNQGRILVNTSLIKTILTKNILGRNEETCMKNSGRIIHKMQIGLNVLLYMSLLNCRHGGFDNTTQDERNAVHS